MHVYIRIQGRAYVILLIAFNDVFQFSKNFEITDVSK